LQILSVAFVKGRGGWVDSLAGPKYSRLPARQQLTCANFHVVFPLIQ
jgi:hypothetical protein